MRTWIDPKTGCKMCERIAQTSGFNLFGKLGMVMMVTRRLRI